MSWVEDQWWFGMEDMVIEARERQAEARRMIKQGYWMQADWEPIALRAMTDTHLNNCVKMIESGRLKRRWALPYLKAEIDRRNR